ncbi:MAG: Holliday junction branch migration protein RuvA [Acidobacteria bacterium]|nr:Holliday junction branch migration protein RuvA [Acidobacteriota bacterium]MBU1473793.1 Holliday junction branch migration protein RuvA [Acidobacteriota bacterium]MBU2438328.1 Holliday junction branch migration protein RuvA [Acidobacteriota bacterium]MBU4496295.1 Holliday junction branch migration protein RuvA [Acidobacteriota bacterium]
MIGRLKGVLWEKSAARIVIDVQGIGYDVHIPLSSFLKLGKTGEPVDLRIYTHMTDNSISLYGFFSEEERDLFLKLIGISGIGPKIGLNILSGIEVSDLEEAIRSSDIARISLVPGIGKKTAMRIALELHEKLGKKDVLPDVKTIKVKEDLISALLNLGFRRSEVEKTVVVVLRECGTDTEFETLLRESLKLHSRL